MNATTSCPLSPPTLPQLPFIALQKIAESCAGLMSACRVESVTLADGRKISLTAPETAVKK